ncbi:MAG TPA: hypothetical protein VHF70_02265 [Rubrobacteraceae bacterium]|nr:hypothetical protein [Rubrobacteraceae bacterium]
MPKRLKILIGMLAVLLAIAAPALAQEGPQEGEPAETPPAADTVTLSFEVTVRGEPPEGTTLLGFIPAEGGIRVPLTDPDGDGIYTGSTTLDRFGPGPRPVPPGTEPVSLPVQIAQESGGNIEVIRDFGEVPLTGDRTFRARANFGSGTTTTPDPETPSPDTGPSSTTDPASGVDVNEDGLIDESDGEVAAAISNKAMEAARSSGEPSLPATGGLPLTLGAVLLLVAGLLGHRALRALRALR